MKSIRNIALSALLTLGAFTTITYTSCDKDECKDVVCNNGGTCIDGLCQCATGYEGTNCETEIRAKVIKTWTAKDVKVSDQTALPTYNSAISKGVTVTDILISDFSDEFFVTDVKATIVGNTITIPPQEPDNDGYKVSGTGTYNATDKKITWSYTITSPTTQTISYTGTWE